MSRRPPEVSVVIPAYNAARYVGAAVDSVLAQTFQDFELIVVDDGSTDETRSVLSAYGPPVRYVPQQNRGMAGARNRGIGECSGRYVGFLDADDTWLPEKLERQLSALREQPQVKVCYTSCVVADEELRPIHVQGSERAASALEDLLFRGNVVGSVCTPLIERTLLEQVGGFDPEMSHCADWDLWVRLARHTEFLFLAEPLVTYRQHGSNLSRRIEPLERDSLRVLEKAFSDPSTPEGLRRRADQAWGRTWMMLAGCYYHVRRFRDFLRCTVKALSWDPAQAARLVLYPWRRLRGTSDWRRQFR